MIDRTVAETEARCGFDRTLHEFPRFACGERKGLSFRKTAGNGG